MTLSKEIQDCPNQGHRLNALSEIFRTGVDFAFSVSGVVGFDPGGKEEAFLLSVANSNSSVAAPPSCLQCGC